MRTHKTPTQEENVKKKEKKDGQHNDDSNYTGNHEIIGLDGDYIKRHFIGRFGDVNELSFYFYFFRGLEVL